MLIWKFQNEYVLIYTIYRTNLLSGDFTLNDRVVSTCRLLVIGWLLVHVFVVQTKQEMRGEFRHLFPNLNNKLLI